MIKELIGNCLRDLDLISKFTAGSKCFIYATKCKYVQYILEGFAELNKKYMDTTSEHAKKLIEFSLS